MQNPRQDAIAFAATFIETATEKYIDDTFRAQAAALTPAGKKTLYDGLVEYARAYSGTFAPVLSVRDFLRKNHEAKLTLGQCRMLANSMRVETQTAQRRSDLDAVFPPEPIASKAAPVPDVPVAEVVPDGYYTVVFDDGKHVTLRVRHWTKPGKPEWMQVVSLLVGPANTADYRGIAFLEGKRIQWWRAFAGDRNSSAAKALHHLVGTEDAWKTAGVAYALASKKCFICNRELTDPTSIELGIGPICREQTGF